MLRRRLQPIVPVRCVEPGGVQEASTRVMENMFCSHLVRHPKEVKVAGHAQRTVVGVTTDYLLHAARVDPNLSAADVPRARVPVIPCAAADFATEVAVLRVP